jgi:chromosome segregation ATPase
MDFNEFKKIKKNIDKALKEVETEIFQEGIDITSSETQKIFEEVKNSLIIKLGHTVAEYASFENAEKEKKYQKELQKAEEEQKIKNEIASLEEKFSEAEKKIGYLEKLLEEKIDNVEKKIPDIKPLEKNFATHIDSIHIKEEVIGNLSELIFDLKNDFDSYKEIVDEVKKDLGQIKKQIELPKVQKESPKIKELEGKILTFENRIETDFQNLLREYNLKVQSIDQQIGRLVFIGGGGSSSGGITAETDPIWIADKPSYVPYIGNADIEITDTTKGVIITAPDSSRWRITINNAGLLVTTSI